MRASAAWAAKSCAKSTDPATMSRIGKKLIQVPAGVDVTLSETEVRVKGPKGELKLALHPHVRLERAGDVLTVSVKSEENKKDRALWGLFNRLVANMVVGVTKGYEK